MRREQWRQHWSFVSPVRPPLPNVSKPAWLRNEIDAFVLARLDQEKLAPSAEADRRTLIRRVSFDLTGLPPSPDEVRDFVADSSNDAYEKVVERLLSSPRYAERMAVRWKVKRILLVPESVSKMVPRKRAGCA